MAKEKYDNDRQFALGKENFKILGIGFIVIIIGYLLMIGGGSDDLSVFNEDELYSFRRITLAPIVIVIGFIIEGYGIMKKPKKNK